MHPLSLSISHHAITATLSIDLSVNAITAMLSIDVSIDAHRSFEHFYYEYALPLLAPSLLPSSHLTFPSRDRLFLNSR
jgi:hypothetical protein